MNRSEFLKKLGLGVIVATVAPKVLLEEKSVVKDREYYRKAWDPIYAKYPHIYKDAFPPTSKYGWYSSSCHIEPEIFKELVKRYGNMDMCTFYNTVAPLK